MLVKNAHPITNILLYRPPPPPHLILPTSSITCNPSPHLGNIHRISAPPPDLNHRLHFRLPLHLILLPPRLSSAPPPHLTASSTVCPSTSSYKHLPLPSFLKPHITYLLRSRLPNLIHLLFYPRLPFYLILLTSYITVYPSTLSYPTHPSPSGPPPHLSNIFHFRLPLQLIYLTSFTTVCPPPHLSNIFHYRLPSTSSYPCSTLQCAFPPHFIFHLYYHLPLHLLISTSSITVCPSTLYYPHPLLLSAPPPHLNNFIHYGLQNFKLLHLLLFLLLFLLLPLSYSSFLNLLLLLHFSCSLTVLLSLYNT